MHAWLRDASDIELHGRYDLVTAFECLHDMSDPVRVLQSMRQLAGEKGSVIVMDERALEEFQPCSGSLEQLLYGFSILHCLPAGMSEQPSAGTGTVYSPEDYGTLCRVRLASAAWKSCPSITSSSGSTD